MSDLTSLLFTGLQETLAHASTTGVLQPPYGRPTMLTTQDIEDKVNGESSSEEEEDEDDDAREEEESDEEVEFEYNYGFVSWRERARERERGCIPPLPLPPPPLSATHTCLGTPSRQFPVPVLSCNPCPRPTCGPWPTSLSNPTHFS
jgi:hypothetical protein